MSQLAVSHDADSIKEDRDQLKRRITELNREIQDKDSTIDEMANKINELKDLEMKYIDANDDKQLVIKQLKERDRDIEFNKISLENLQTALSEQQENYEWRIEELEKEKIENEEDIKRYQNSISLLQNELRTKMADNTKVEVLQKLNSQLNSDINHLISQKEGVEQELETIKDTIKTYEMSKKHMIDRRIINQFLVQYLNHNSDDSVKKEMLETMSSMLEFSIEEKQTLGLVEKPKSEKKKEDIGAKFLDFLLGEDEGESD